ncbi:MAG: hypothetical protein EBX15_01830, partial [Acidimicrobiia bacterium]|nr:hypothetical protein [Acidimicrobiia bacterium]
MARYTGPKVRISRRLGINVFENAKGTKALDRRPFPPGPHGRTRRRSSEGEYLNQLQEKQKAKYIYGVLERQFRKIYETAVRMSGPADLKAKDIPLPAGIEFVNGDQHIATLSAKARLSVE